MKTFVIDSIVWHDVLSHPEVVKVTGECEGGPPCADFERQLSSYGSLFTLKNVPRIRFLVIDDVFMDSNGELKKVVNSPPLQSILDTVRAAASK